MSIGIITSLLNGVTKRMTKVEYRTLSIFKRICLHNIDFHLDRLSYKSLEFTNIRWRSIPILSPVSLLYLFEQIRFSNQAVLYDFCHTRNKIRLMQSLEGCYIRYNLCRLLVNSYHVFPLGKIDAGFSSNTSIHHSYQACRTLDDIYSPHIGFSHISCNISNNTPSKRNNRTATIKSPVKQFIIHGLDSNKRFVLSSGRNFNNMSYRRAARAV